MASNTDKEHVKADYLNGMKHKDIVKKHNIKPNTLKSWVKRYRWNELKKGAPQNEKKGAPLIDAKEHSQKQNLEPEELDNGNGELTQKQGLFCIYYLQYFNATKAYQKVYQCDYATARTNGSRMLTNANIKYQIGNLKQERLNREFFSQEDIFQKYMDIAFADITDFVEFGNKEIELEDKSGNKITTTISYVNIRSDMEVDGTIVSEVSKGKDGVKVKLHDRLRALQWLADHMDMATEKQKLEIEYVKAKTKAVKLTTEKDDDAKDQVKDWKEAIIEIAKRRSAVDARSDTTT